MSSNVSTPSVTFLRHRSISPEAERQKMSAVRVNANCTRKTKANVERGMKSRINSQWKLILVSVFRREFNDDDPGEKKSISILREIMMIRGISFKQFLSNIAHLQMTI